MIFILTAYNQVKNNDWWFGFIFYSRQNFVGLTVALDDKGEAEGQMFWDDGQSIGKYDPTPREPASHSEHCIIEAQHVLVGP